jgi:hypothetical protein
MRHMRSVRSIQRRAGLIALVAASASCGDVVRQGRAPVYLVVDTFQVAKGGSSSTTFTSGPLLSDVLTLKTTPAPCSDTTPCPTIFDDFGQVTLRISLKDLGPTTTAPTPTHNNEVTITRYRVDYIRADGRNTPGVDVPYGFDSAITGTVPMNATLIIGFELVRHVAKEESPLVQLINDASVVNTIAHVTFYGHDQVGNEINVTASMGVEFGNFGDGS